MVKRKITTVTLKTDTADQLRQIARAHGLTLTELVQRYVDLEIRRGTISEPILALQLSKVERQRFKLAMNGLSIFVNKSDVEKIADAIEQVAARPSTYVKNGKTENHYGQDFWAGRSRESCAPDLLTAKRRGRGLVVTLRKGRRSVRSSLSPSEACRIAAHLREVVRR